MLEFITVTVIAVGMYRVGGRIAADEMRRGDGETGKREDGVPGAWGCRHRSPSTNSTTSPVIRTRYTSQKKKTEKKEKEKKRGRELGRSWELRNLQQPIRGE